MKKLQKPINLIFILIFFLSFSAIAFTAKEISGIGPYPYNFHIIDNHVYAGGHPLNPATNFNNSDKQVLTILKYLKSLGIRTVIDLENTSSIQDRYEKLLKIAGLNRLHIPLTFIHVPNQKEWKEIKLAMQQPVYIHCKWGADRTGAVVGRYLVEKYKYTPEKAYKSLISGCKYAGHLGGLKTGWIYNNLKNFIWFGPQDK